MDNLKKWLKFNLSYLNRPPWDTRVSPPELAAFVASHPPGYALDLGCGSGTNSLALARAGWNVVGVDFSLIAVLKARRSLQNYRDQVRIRFGDVTNPGNVSGSYQLVLDIGCFHSLTSRGKARYLENLGIVLAPHGHLLMYAHLGMPGEEFRSGILESDVESINQVLQLIERTDSADPGGRPAAWLLFKRLAGHPVIMRCRDESVGKRL